MENEKSDHVTARAVAGATRSDGSASADSPSASVARSWKIANAVNSPTLYTGNTAESRVAPCSVRDHLNGVSWD